MKLTKERAARYIRYEPETGNLYWINNVSERGPNRIGQLAGNSSGHGYRQIRLLGHRLYCHQLAWLLIFGYIPIELDHINGIRDDNRITNLREVTRTQNNANYDKISRGVEVLPSGRFSAYITVRGKRSRLGTFDKKEDAQEAYNVAADKAFGEFARINRRH